MKTKELDFTLLIAVVLLLTAFAFQIGGTVKGRVVPSTNAINVYAISGNDTSSCAVINGSFQFRKLKPGTYQFMIEAIDPYTHTFIKNILVRDSETTHIGDIQLQLK